MALLFIFALEPFSDFAAGAAKNYREEGKTWLFCKRKLPD